MGLYMLNKVVYVNGEESVLFHDIETVKFINNGLVVDCKGLNNKIIFGKNVRINNLKININSNNNIIYIEDGVTISGNIIMKITDGNRLSVGKNTSIGGASFICGEGKSISIGDNCMIAWGIEFRNTDSHAIFDLDSKERVNLAEDIIIKNNVWIGAHSTILKGVIISDGSIVSIKSLVTKKFMDTNIIIGGVPAKVIKRNVYWERPLLG